MGECEEHEKRLTDVERAVSTITTEVQRVVTEVKELKSMIERTIKYSDDHQAVLYGEHGEVGMIGRFQEISKIVAELRDVLKGKDDKPGMIAKMDDLAFHFQEIRDWNKWIVRLVAGTFITGLIGVVIELILK